jgi:para-nitrobenzyl esterase
MTLAQAERQGLEFARAMGARSLAELRATPARRLLSVPYRSRAIVDGDIIVEQTYEAFAAGRQARIPLLVGYNRDEREMPHKWPIWTWARLHARAVPDGTFVYHFAHVPPFGPFPRTGAAHGAELLYVFGYPPPIVHHVVELPWTARRHIALGDEIRTYWTNFAKGGDPNGAALPRWPAFGAGHQALELAETHRVIDMPDRAAHDAMDAEMERHRARSQAALPPEAVR